MITQRGHNRLPCFIGGGDYEKFRSILWDSADRAQCTIHAALMLPAAYWVLASPSDETGISRMIQRTGRCYVRHCNEKYRREGTLWAGRYKACLVQPSDEMMQHCASYLRYMPSMSGVTTAGTVWPWCFLQDDLATGSAPDSLDEFYDVATTLNMGLVLGSPDFCREVSLTAGMRTIPAIRGRPRKTDRA